MRSVQFNPLDGLLLDLASNIYYAHTKASAKGNNSPSRSIKKWSQVPLSYPQVPCGFADNQNSRPAPVFYTDFSQEISLLLENGLKKSDG